MLLGKAKLNAIEVLISKALIDTYISCDEFSSINNVLREYNEMKEVIKNPETSVQYTVGFSFYSETIFFFFLPESQFF